MLCTVLEALKTSSQLIFTQLYQGGVNITTFKQKKTKLNLWERKELGHGTQSGKVRIQTQVCLAFNLQSLRLCRPPAFQLSATSMLLTADGPSLTCLHPQRNNREWKRQASCTEAPWTWDVASGQRPAGTESHSAVHLPLPNQSTGGPSH